MVRANIAPKFSKCHTRYVSATVSPTRSVMGVLTNAYPHMFSSAVHNGGVPGTSRHIHGVWPPHRHVSAASVTLTKVMYWLRNILVFSDRFILYTRCNLRWFECAHPCIHSPMHPNTTNTYRVGTKQGSYCKPRMSFLISPILCARC